ncbi:hypothetical protein [Clostridium sp. AM58-1XD]|uniref:hypothetical protein n=1 Tax=Clostridium sp. AM58-1XD TaxID=2292307 RepID=UPI000E53E074|nr:hypothetical protein [Clostridium sp. AM58-1XD]RGY97279.1 hypothetical protein DXA13_15170 [Clostridium sp. AM58-1XD]
MLLTNILKLKKPEGTDPVDVQDFNDNADVLDTAIGDKVSKTGDIANTTISSFTPSTASYPIPVAGDTAKISFGKIKKFCEDIRNTATGACYIGQIVNNCVTNNAKLPLSAAQGKVLMDLYTQLNSDLSEVNAAIATKAAQTALQAISYRTDNLEYRLINKRLSMGWDAENLMLNFYVDGVRINGLQKV